mgnify:CR=1 FL=1
MTESDLVPEAAPADLADIADDVALAAREFVTVVETVARAGTGTGGRAGRRVDWASMAASRAIMRLISGETSSRF